MTRRLISIVAVGAAAGFALGRFTAEHGPDPTVPRRVEGKERPTLPRKSLAEQHTILIGEGRGPEAKEDPDGTFVLRPSGLGRVLTFEADDADVALAAVGRFVAGVRGDLVTERGPGRATLGDIYVLWRVEGDGAKRLLRVVAVPTDPYGSEKRASRIAEAIAEWCIVNGAYSRTVTSSEDQAAAITSVRALNAKGAMPVFDAAEEEFRVRGMTLAQEETVQGAIIEVARDADGSPSWSFFWSEDQVNGTFGVYHHADPFDTAGEQGMLLAILRRALGREVRIQLDAPR